jgi:hypothetical protein
MVWRDAAMYTARMYRAAMYIMAIHARRAAHDAI